MSQSQRERRDEEGSDRSTEADSEYTESTTTEVDSEYTESTTTTTFSKEHLSSNAVHAIHRPGTTVPPHLTHTLIALRYQGCLECQRCCSSGRVIGVATTGCCRFMPLLEVLLLLLLVVS